MSSFGSQVLAQGNELPNPGLTPDSPFYFLDTLGEKIGMFFTFGAEKKAEKAMQYAEEKFIEANVRDRVHTFVAGSVAGYYYLEVRYKEPSKG